MRIGEGAVTTRSRSSRSDPYRRCSLNLLARENRLRINPDDPDRLPCRSMFWPFGYGRSPDSESYDAPATGPSRWFGIELPWWLSISVLLVCFAIGSLFISRISRIQTMYSAPQGEASPAAKEP